MTIPVGQEQLIPSDTRVRYIKLGRKGGWEKQCIEEGIIRYGFGCDRAERFPLCIHHQWEELMKSFVEEFKDKKEARNCTNQTLNFFEDDGSTLWITFHGEDLYWGFLDKSSQPAQHADGQGVWRAVAGGWKHTDRNGKLLTKDRLESSITKLAQFPRTSCSPRSAKCIIRSINGQKTPGPAD